jgi:3-isopropylmalate dehydrogenase
VEPFIRVSGRAAPLLRPNVDTEVMIRVDRLLSTPREELGRWFLEAWRYGDDGSEAQDFELNQPQFRDARILLAGENFGCGSSREGAVWALAGYGIRAVIAPSFGDIFESNCFQNGILPVRMGQEEVQAIAAELRDATEMTVDLDECTITTPAGRRVAFTVAAERRDALLAGLDEIGMTLRLDGDIRAYQERELAARPWLRPVRARIVAIGGDGVGPEVMEQTLRIAAWFSERRGLAIELREELWGPAAWAAHASLMPEDTWRAITEADAVLFGATSYGTRDYRDVPEKVDWLLEIRRRLDLFTNLRPVRPLAALLGNSTLKPEALEGADILVVRELTGGVYFSQPRGITRHPDGTREVVNTIRYTDGQITRIARAAFELARERRGHVHSVDKAIVLEAGNLWREVVAEVHEAEFADVGLTHMLVDNCAMQLVRNPRQFDVIVTENLFGDILSDCAAMVAGSLGMLPSAALGPVREDGRRHALYEPIHGSAPDIAGQGIVNPLGSILSFALCLRHSLRAPGEAELLERAVEAAVGRGVYTRDIAPQGVDGVPTAAMGDAVLEELQRLA